MPQDRRKHLIVGKILMACPPANRRAPPLGPSQPLDRGSPHRDNNQLQTNQGPSQLQTRGIRLNNVHAPGHSKRDDTTP
jgi:hypothetical protein